MTENLRAMVRMSIFLLIFIPIALAGCGTDDRCFVEGTVTCDGRPFSYNHIIFHDESQGRGGSAELSESGTYHVQGPLRPGTYVVVFTPPPAPARPSVPSPPKPKAAPIPAKYRAAATSPLTVEVIRGHQRCDFDLKHD
jgi:hypothetical protein